MSPKQSDVQKEGTEELGFVSPAFKIAEKLGDDFQSTIEDCWQIIDTHHVTGLKYMYPTTGLVAEH